jgi:hypothetical protein
MKALGDINGDGKADILATEPVSGGGVNYMVGTSQGNNSFAWSFTHLKKCTVPNQVTLGDNNGTWAASSVFLASGFQVAK